eukprot:CAMPEP_0114357010 /NCGR_PEP_ID=MMETSP0101-20121206/21341_1 /TAXON_ID=38822 ORGANISM="Pteridomonas danica, Strain PT" /NCGR_SAMPLE_ID=MMETSP0101 /ASSEMBLY_ACC=CAM_ASM_000211 /LENGTH=221 /DNA_ID=CAMNT_0001499629 /DNA_START=923 /DNA_END=1585 /DNA_ORIENTATION=-
MVRFARRYHAKSFAEFKKADAEKVANQLLGPYAEMMVAEVHAKTQQNDNLMKAAQSRIQQIRDSMIQLIGLSSTQAKLQEVEAAIKQQFIDSYGEVPPPPPPVEQQSSLEQSSNSSSSSSSSSSATAASSQNNDKGAADEETSLNMKEIESSLMNEQIAHELILDSHYQLPSLPEPLPFSPPPSPTSSSTTTSTSSSSSNNNVTPADIEAKIAATMQDVFW